MFYYFFFLYILHSAFEHVGFCIECLINTATGVYYKRVQKLPHECGTTFRGCHTHPGRGELCCPVADLFVENLSKKKYKKTGRKAKSTDILSIEIS